MERVAESLRRRSRLRVRERPSLAIPRLGYLVREVDYLGAGVLGRTERGSRIIEIAPHTYEPKREYTLAHELLELALSRRHFKGRHRERACQRGAAGFLLPSIAFKHTLFRSGWELPSLIRKWRWASAEAIGFRINDLFPWARFVVWSDSRVRVSGGGPPTVMELEAYERAVRRGCSLVVEGGQAVTAWHLSEPGVRVKVAAVGVPATAEQAAWWARRG